MALEEERFDDARRAFQAALEGAEQKGEDDLSIACSFYLGLANQLEAKALESSEKRTDLLRQAAKWYERIGSRLEGAEGLVGNLARVYSDVNESGKADALFKKAIGSAKGAPRLVLQRSYGDLLAEQGRWQEAYQLYGEVLESEPSDQATWEALLSMVSEKAPSELPKAVWGAVDANQTYTAQRFALAALSAKDTIAPQRIALLAAIAASLSRQHYPPESFARGPVGSRLEELKSDPQIGKGAEGLLSVHGEVVPGPESLWWWSEKRDPYPRSPLQALRVLLRSLATRRGEEETGPARRTLELADRLASDVPDLPLYIDLATTYDAADDKEALSSSLERWERSLRRTADQFSPALRTRYHLIMAESVNRLGVNAAPDEVTSESYQLAQARKVAEQAGARALQALVEESERRLLPSGGGDGGGMGGSGGGDRYARRRFHPAGLGCLDGPGGCSSFYVEVPDLVPRYEDLGKSVTRWARVERGCAGPRTVTWHFTPSLPPQDASSTILRASFASRNEPPQAPCPVRQLAGAALEDFPTSCPKVELAPQPRWVTAGAWGDAASFFVVDALRSQLLHYGVDGRLLEIVKDDYPSSLLPTRVRQTPSGRLIMELGFGYLVWLDGKGKASRGTSLVGRQGAQGTLRGIEDWTVLGEDTVLAVAIVEHPNGSWVSGLVRLRLSSDSFEVIKEWPADDPAGVYYRIGQPYLAALGEKGYFLEIGEAVSLYEISEAPQASLRLISRSESGLPEGVRKRLSGLQAPSDTVALYQVIEQQPVPAGLYARDGLLFLLRRVEERLGEASWSIEKIDPAKGGVVHSTALPSRAHHLTVIPGGSHWVLLERGVVKGLGDQGVASVVFVPSPLIEDSASNQRSPIRTSTAFR